MVLKREAQTYSHLEVGLSVEGAWTVMCMRG